MKRTLLTTIICITIVILLLFIFNNKTNNGEKFIYNKDELYDIAIEYLKKEEYSNLATEKNQKSPHFFVKYDKFGTTEKADKQYAYMWILGENYYLQDDKVTSGSAYSMFFKFSFINNKVIEYENPKDGTEYVESIKKMSINNKMANKIINYNLKLNNDKEIQEYYTKVKNPQKLEIKDISGENGLLFTISHNNKKCIPVSLNIYLDNQYKLFTHYEACKKGESCNNILKYTKYQNGTYDYDVIKIIQNSQNADNKSFTKDEQSEYEIYTGNEEIINMMITDKHNKYLEEFLKITKIKLNTCATPEYKK